MKTCKKCNIDKEDNEFRPNRWICKLCTKVNRKTEYLEKKEILCLKKREWNKRNPDKVKLHNRATPEKRKEYRDRYKKKISDYNKFYEAIHKEELNAKNRLAIANLEDRYVRYKIMQVFGIDRNLITVDIINTYREQIKVKRLLKQLKNGNTEKNTEAS